MKHIEVAWIEQILTFDDPQEVQQKQTFEKGVMK